MISLGPASAVDLPCRNVKDRVRSVLIDDFELWYKETGTDKGKPPVIVLHGGPGMSSCYFKNCFQFLEKNHQVVLYDQRGSGFSQIKPDLDYYTMDKLVAELDTIRGDILKSDRIILIGHSFGGLVAMNYAMAHEKRIERMVLVSPSMPWTNFKTAIRPVTMILKNGFPPFDPEKGDEWFLKIFPSVFANSFYDAEGFNLLEPGYASLATYLSVRKSLGKYDFREQLAQLETKTLIAYGAADLATTNEKDQIKLSRCFKKSTLKKFNASGHWSFMEEPAVFQETASAFLEN